MKQLSKTQLSARINRFKDRKIAQVLTASETTDQPYKIPVRRQQQSTAAWANYIAL